MLTIIKPFCQEIKRESRMDKVLSGVAVKYRVKYILTADQLKSEKLTNRKIIFAICLSKAGINVEYYKMLEYIRQNANCLKNSVAGIIVDGDGELFTKSLARRLAFSANSAGCTFIGKPLVEATGSLYNFKIMSMILDTDNMGAYASMVDNLLHRVDTFEPSSNPHKKLLMIHASSRSTSNSLLLWDKVKKNLPDQISINEISLRNGEIIDCRGCKYEDCLHHGEKGDCFYGGIMVEKVYPAIVECDALVMVCPNYNDSVSANISAFINRLTSVFRSNDFSTKSVYAIVISGYSGGDIVAEQIINAMNFNKNFILPGNFALVETANEPKSILKIENIDKKAAEFAKHIR